MMSMRKNAPMDTTVWTFDNQAWSTLPVHLRPHRDVVVAAGRGIMKATADGRVQYLGPDASFRATEDWLAEAFQLERGIPYSPISGTDRDTP